MLCPKAPHLPHTNLSPGDYILQNKKKIANSNKISIFSLGTWYQRKNLKIQSVMANVPNIILYILPFKVKAIVTFINVLIYKLSY